jgi:putative membrane protein
MKSKSGLLLQKKYFMNFLTRLVTSSLAIIIVTYLLRPGVTVDEPVTAIIVAAVLALLNMVIKPLLIILTLPITVVSLGLFLLVINALMVMLAANIVPGFHVNGFWWALLFSIILSIVTGIFNSLAKPDRKEN